MWWNKPFPPQAPFGHSPYHSNREPTRTPLSYERSTTSLSPIRKHLWFSAQSNTVFEDEKHLCWLAVDRGLHWFPQFKETKAFSYSPGQGWRNPMLNAIGFLLSCKELLSKLGFFVHGTLPVTFVPSNTVTAHTHTNVRAQWLPVCSVTRLCSGYQNSTWFLTWKSMF